MAHNIRSMFYVGQVPWHRLGKKLETEATAAEAIAAAGLDWEVRQEELIYRGFGSTAGRDFLVPDRVANVRGDTGEYLGTVGQTYEPVQNREAFRFFDSVVGEGQAFYHTAGQLGRGERVWILARIPGELLIAGKDKVEKYLVLANAHDGSMALRAFFTPIRVVCQNTLNVALGRAEGGISIRHNGDVKHKVKEARRVLGFAAGYYQKFGVFAEALAARRVAAEEHARFVAGMFPEDDKDGLTDRIKRSRAELDKRILRGAGHREMGFDGTAWGLFNGAAEYADFGRTFRGSDDGDRRSRRLESIWLGTSARFKNRAADLVGEITGIKAEELAGTAVGTN